LVRSVPPPQAASSSIARASTEAPALVHDLVIVILALHCPSPHHACAGSGGRQPPK
jgi:hypothetical protein